MDKRIILIYIIVLIDVIVGTALSPIMPEFVKGMSHASFWLAMATALFTGMQLITSPILGKLSDEYGRRPIFIFSAIGTLIFNALLLPVRAWSLYANRAGDGATNGMYSAVRSAITDLSDKENLFRNMGYEGAIASVGIIVGPMVSGLVIAFTDYSPEAQTRAIILVSVILACLNVLLCFLMVESHPSPSAETKFKLRDMWGELQKALNVANLLRNLRAKSEDKPQIAKIVGMQIFLTLSLGYYFYYVNYLTLGPLQFSIEEVAYNFIFFGALGIVANFLFFTFLVNKFNKRQAVIWLSFIGVLLHIAYANVGSSKIGLYVIVTIDSFTIAFVMGLLEGILANQTTEDDRGEIFGISQGLNAVASFFTALVFAVLSLISYELPFYWFALCTAGVMFLAWTGKELDEETEKEASV